MRVDREKYYGVITGDIVGSARYTGSKRQRLNKAMKLAGDRLLESFPDSLTIPVDIFRGDSWQCIIEKPEQCLRIGLSYRAGVKAILNDNKADSRVAVGIGRIEFLPENRVSEGDGEAFRISGRLIENLPQGSRMGFAISGKENRKDAEAISVIVSLIDAIAGGWTAKQCLAVAGALRGYSQARIADVWHPNPISQQSVAQHLNRSNWNVIGKALEFVKSTIKLHLRI